MTVRPGPEEGDAVLLPDDGEPDLLARALLGAVDGAADDQPHARLLDVAHDLFCRQGIARTTMDDVARGAGLSRITVYRRLASKEALVEQVVLREFRRYFDQFLLDVSGAATVQERVVTGFVSSMRAIRNNTLIAGVLGQDPALAAPSVLGGQGRTMAAVAGFVAGQLAREQAAGHLADDLDTGLVAEILVRVSASFLLVPSTRVDVSDDAQLAELARRHLVPMLRVPDDR